MKHFLFLILLSFVVSSCTDTDGLESYNTSKTTVSGIALCSDTITKHIGISS